MTSVHSRQKKHDIQNVDEWIITGYEIIQL